MVDTPVGPAMALVYMNSCDIDTYFRLIGNRRYPDVRTASFLPFTIDLEAYARLSASYNVEFRTGFVWDNKSVALSGADIYVDITPAFFCHPTTFLDQRD